MAKMRAKRLLDVGLSGLALAALSPLLAATSAAIVLESRGRVLFRQERVGKGKTRFEVIKFRTMYHRDPSSIDQRAEAVVSSNADARITRVGRLLRITSIDELPQLVNVLRGDMSLVGPRPVLPAQLEAIPEERMTRFDVPPGLTGLAQVRGRRSLDWLEQLEADAEYVGRQSLGLDLVIIARTVLVLATASGIYGDASRNWRNYIREDKATSGGAEPLRAESA